ncbi:tetratricopeptide repeat protein [Patescibacteria group bacterium]|nr:MAG: tetratricopeptide repeat protein [Patescibacteria group bacterium]
MSKYLRYTLILGLMAALAMPFVYTPSTVFPFVFGKAIFFSLLIEILAVLYAILAVLEPKYRPRPSLLLYALSGYLATMLLSTVFGEDAHRSFWGNHERMSGVFTILHFFVLFFIARSVLNSKRAWNLFWSVFLATSAIMATLAIVEHFFPQALMVNAPGGRVWATLGNYIYLGVYMSFALFAGGYLLTITRRVFSRSLIALTMLADFYVILLTESRTTLLALVLVAAALVLLAAWRAKGKWRRVAAAGVLLFALAVIGLFLARDTALVAKVPAISRLFQTSLTAGGDRTRLIAWQIAWDAWKAKPFFGWGPENYYQAFNFFYRPESLIYSYYETWFDRAHNSVLDALSMTGLIGLMVYLGVFAAAAAVVARRIRSASFTHAPAPPHGGTVRGSAPQNSEIKGAQGVSPWSFTFFQGVLWLSALAAYFLENLFAFDALSGFLLFYLVLAFIDKPEQAADVPAEPAVESPAATPKRPVFARLLIILPMVLVAFWAADVNLREWRANQEGLLSIVKMREGRLADAAALHASALSRGSPHANQIRADFAREVGQNLGFTQQGRGPDALRLAEIAVYDLRRNIEEGKDVYDYALLAQLLIMLGPTDLRTLKEAEAVIKTALPLSPKRQQLGYTLARIYILEGQRDAAVSVLEQTMRDEPRLAEAHMLLAIALFDAGRQQEAWNEIQEALLRRYGWTNKEEMVLARSLGMKYGVPGNPLTLAEYAKMEARLGYTTSALFYVGQAVSKDPSLFDYKTLVNQIIAENTGASGSAN